MQTRDRVAGALTCVKHECRPLLSLAYFHFQLRLFQFTTKTYALMRRVQETKAIALLA